MNPSLNLYPAKIQAQCACAITQLDEQISALNVLKGSITEFVNDSSIHSVSFDQLKSQCRNYLDVIDAMIYCNEQDKTDFVTLQGSVGNEDLVGAIIDKWERYYKQKLDETRRNYENVKGMVSGYAALQMQAYYANLIQMYQQLYDYWYAKELAYLDIDGKTSILFTRSSGRDNVVNLLGCLKDSFSMNEGYDSNVIAAQLAKIKEIVTESIEMNPSVIEDTARAEMTKKNRERAQAESAAKAKSLEEAKDIEIMAAIDSLNQNSKYDENTWNSSSLAEREQALQDYYDEVVSIYGLRKQDQDLTFIAKESKDGIINHGAHHSDDNYIHINEYWIDPNNNYSDSYSVYTTVVHECRHAYQREAIKSPKKFEVSAETRKAWQESFDNYKTAEMFKQEHSDWTSSKCLNEYRKQAVEKDARKIAGQK